MIPNRPLQEQFIQQLSKIPLFIELEDSFLRALAQASRWREYEAGEVVVLEGDAQPGLYYLQYGWLKAVKTSPTGREQILRFLEPGETFNEVGVFANQPNPATAIALEPAGIWLIPRAALIQLLQEKPKFAQHVIGKMAERMLYLVSLVTDLSLRPVTGRLARLLLDDAVDDILERPRWYTQIELAARLGTVPDVVQRALRSLEGEGLIAVDRRQIRILDRQTLAEIAL
ncbi:MAG: Crp/Fnr family transcriptional regulator [Anaerolineales bacterium]|nr:Crp/Fnr family transcriptional regulator [Anaerolineales bacterium]